MIQAEALLLPAAICFLAVAYSYVLYPVLLLLLVKLRGTRGPQKEVGGSKEGAADARNLPSVTLLVAAHNEAEVIAQRIENALASDYPADRLEILIASDGSTDKTEEIVASYEERGVKLLALSPNRGKSATLNRALEEASGDIIVMSDANTVFSSDAIALLASGLGDESIAAVCGKLQILDPATGTNVDGLYWRYESWLKNMEGRVRATLGANGGIYAFRREQYVPIADNTILDDLTIPLLIKLKHGGAVVFDENASAHEEAPADIGDEFRRRVRIGTGAYQSLKVLWPLLNPRHGATTFAFFSHKLMRWLSPFFLLAFVLVVLLGVGHPLFNGLAVVMVLLGVAAFRSTGSASAGFISRCLRLLAMFASMNAALFLGFIRWLSGPQTGVWSRTER